MECQNIGKDLCQNIIRLICRGLAPARQQAKLPQQLCLLGLDLQQHPQAFVLPATVVVSADGVAFPQPALIQLPPRLIGQQLQVGRLVKEQEGGVRHFPVCRFILPEQPVPDGCLSGFHIRLPLFGLGRLPGIDLLKIRHCPRSFR